MYIVLFVVFLNLRRGIFFCVGEFGFFYSLNSLNRVRACAGTPYSAPRDLQKQDCVIARFSCYSTKKKFRTLYKILPNPVNTRFSGCCLRCRTDSSVSLLFMNVFRKKVCDFYIYFYVCVYMYVLFG